MKTSGYADGSVNRLCGTRALKNANYLQFVVPTLVPESESEDLRSVPPQLLYKIHTREGEAELNKYPRLAEILRKAPLPRIVPAVISPLFVGTLFFVRIQFVIQSQGSAFIAVSNEDMATAVSYATRAIRPISAYAAQFGQNSLAINTNVVTFLTSLPTPNYNDQQLRGFVNSIAANLPGNACVVVLHPIGLTNTTAQAIGALGYHGKANVPYIWSSFPRPNFTVDDLSGNYAAILSHEIAETVVDPRADGSNPEVCDPCSNCQPAGQNLFLNYFDASGNFIKSSQAIPPDFQYDFFISTIMQPGTQPCPTAAPGLKCAYSPNQLIRIEPFGSFDHKALGDVDTRTLTITNVGLGDVTVALPPSPPLSEATFHWDSGEFGLPVGGRLEIEVDFAPKALGVAQQTLTITSNAPSSPDKIVLSGRGVPGQAE